jgi:hypothetical protein
MAASNSAHYGYYGDWDVGYFKGDCPPPQYIVGLAQTPSGLLANALCAESSTFPQNGGGWAPSRTCHKVALPGSSPWPQPDGYWPGAGYDMLECDANQVVVGVSVVPTTDFPHAIYCCNLEFWQP